TAVRTCIDRIHDEIEQAVLELRRIDPRHCFVVTQLNFECDILAHRTPQQRLCLTNERVQLAHLRLQRLLACECKKLRRESLAASCSDQRGLAQTLTARRVLRITENDVERPDHHREQIVEI